MEGPRSEQELLDGSDFAEPLSRFLKSGPQEVTPPPNDLNPAETEQIGAVGRTAGADELYLHQQISEEIIWYHDALAMAHNAHNV